MRVLLQNHASMNWSLNKWYRKCRLIARTWLAQLVECQFVALHCQMELVQILLQHHFFINVKKWNDNFLTCLKMFLLFWYAFLNLLFFFSNHCFSFPTLKITTEAVSSLGNTFNLFNEWKSGKGLYKIDTFKTLIR